MTALKVIPWSDVIEATPGIVKGARKIFTRSQQAEAGASGRPGFISHLRIDRAWQADFTPGQFRVAWR